MDTPSELHRFLLRESVPTAKYEDDGTQIAVYATGDPLDQVLTLEAYDNNGALLCIADLAIQDFQTGDEWRYAQALDREMGGDCA